MSAGLGTQIESSQTCLRLCSLICVQCPHHFWRMVVTMMTRCASASDHSNHYYRSSRKPQNHAVGAMEDAAFFDCDNAIEDPILWVKGSARCDGVAAFWPTMRLLSCVSMLSASSISKWNTVWSSGVQVPSKFLERWWNHLGRVVWLTLKADTARHQDLYGRM